MTDQTMTPAEAAVEVEDAARCLENFGQRGVAKDLRTAVAALIARNAALEADQNRPHEAIKNDVEWFKSRPYFECSNEQWERHTEGMTERGKRSLANMLAHHCLLTKRDEFGWIVTRFDLINGGQPYWHISNDGKVTYDYDPETKTKRARAEAADNGRG